MKSYIELAEQIKLSKGNEAEAHRKAAEDCRMQLQILREKRAEAIAEGRKADHKSICQDIEFYEGREKFERGAAADKEIPSVMFWDAWKKYREDYDREFDKRAKAYNRLKEQLVKAYADMLDFMNQGNQEKEAYMADADINRSAIKMPEVSAPLDKGKDHISPDGALLVSLSDEKYRVRENVEDIENGVYSPGGVYGECKSEMFHKAAAAPGPKNPQRFLWEQNGHSEYITREEYRERQLANMPEDYRKFVKAQLVNG